MVYMTQYSPWRINVLAPLSAACVLPGACFWLRQRLRRLIGLSSVDLTVMEFGKRQEYSSPSLQGACGSVGGTRLGADSPARWFHEAACIYSTSSSQIPQLGN